MTACLHLMAALLVSWPEVAKVAVMYGVVGLLH